MLIGSIYNCDHLFKLHEISTWRQLPWFHLTWHWSCICMLTSKVCSNRRVVRFEQHDFPKYLKTLYAHHLSKVWGDFEMPLLHLQCNKTISFKWEDQKVFHSGNNLLWLSLCRSSQRETVGSTLKPPKDTVSLPSRAPRGRTRESTLWWFETLQGRTLQISTWKLSVRQRAVSCHCYRCVDASINYHTNNQSSRISSCSYKYFPQTFLILPWLSELSAWERSPASSSGIPLCMMEDSQSLVKNKKQKKVYCMLNMCIKCIIYFRFNSQVMCWRGRRRRATGGWGWTLTLTLKQPMKPSGWLKEWRTKCACTLSTALACLVTVCPRILSCPSVSLFTNGFKPAPIKLVEFNLIIIRHMLHCMFI